jgi:hypothetical protein
MLRTAMANGTIGVPVSCMLIMLAASTVFIGRIYRIYGYGVYGVECYGLCVLVECWVVCAGSEFRVD